MKTMTGSYIVEFIKKNGHARPHDLVQFLNITSAAVHRQLKKLMDAGIIEKRGQAPKVFYQLARNELQAPRPPILSAQEVYLNKNYLYISPVGEVSLGPEAFYQWCVDKKQKKYFLNMVKEYIELRENIYKKHRKGFIDATHRFRTIFPALYLDHIFYQDFYSLPKFGKTKLGQQVLHGKQAQNKKIIKEISAECYKSMQKIIKEHKIQALAWVPHSLPRKIPFLKEFAKYSDIDRPTIDVIKISTGELPVAQKSLNKIDDRIRNAKETILIPQQVIKHKRVLLIDDAVGSGATMNETAKKLKNQGVKEVFGYAIVGSYKGFEVIKEV